ncbi:class I glutamine amidotransferase-like protein [Microdochium trichocladiopsis]|uniref:Class I glutamine amidotransferase-like protein n=1 Tax=Microdochium trichocladiopsis TaxID=1682393 RepID=A0A9P9BTD1_9PEZI|nr:class I glutamine amidotransferase-like protein [Microdochium trichocladiopsis]KAH7035835.1 class I glutamine amidotransferase-like protein [Microdochium trichocladiopsis]
MKVLLVQCYTTDKPWGDMMVQSFADNIQRTMPSAQMDIVKAEAGEVLPDPSPYDLVIMSGGTFNLVDDKPLPWVESAIDYVRAIAKKDVGPKLLGLCWGHQVSQMALGATWRRSDIRPQIGVEKVVLLPEGKSFFAGHDELNLHKFHRRAVETCRPDFTPLAKDHEILMATNGRILSFQGHPELHFAMAQDLVQNAPTYKDLETGFAIDPIDAKHDGEAVWGRIMEWVGKP